MSMEQLIENCITDYGPYAVFLLLILSGIGIALGEEMVTIPAGVLIAHDKLDLAATAVLAYLGIVLADLLWFHICRHYGTPLLHRRWIKRLVHPRRMLEMKHQFERRGVRFVVMARFIPSSRTTAITVAGMFHMPFWQFALATAGCVLVTVPIQLGLGYLVGMGLEQKKSIADLLLHIVGLVLLIVIASLLLGWWTRYRAGHVRPPRAKASWLRRFRKHSRKTAAAPSTNAPLGENKSKNAAV